MSMELFAYVTQASGREISVKVVSITVEQELTRLGFRYNSEFHQWVKPVGGDNEKAALFDALRTLNVCFSGGGSWSPSEVFQYLRSKSLLKGSFLEIIWKTPGEASIESV